MRTRRILSDEQLMAFARDYATVLPGWSIYRDEHSLGLSRALGPVNQNLWLGALSSGDYRILYDVSAAISNLAAMKQPFPRVGMLSQFLSGRHQTVRPSQHALVWPRVATAMRQELKPDICAPLDIAEVTQLCASEERVHVENDLLMMAILYAWLGERDEARRRCIRVQSMPIPDEEPAPERFRAFKAYALDLQRAIEVGAEHQFLNRVT